MYTQLIPSFLWKSRDVFNLGGELVTSISVPFWWQFPELIFGYRWGKTYWGYNAYFKRSL